MSLIDSLWRHALAMVLLIGSRVSVLGLALFVTQAAAQAPLSLEMEAIMISASRGDAGVEAMPLNTTILTQEEIRRSPAQTLDQLLRSVPSLNFTGAPAIQSDPTGQQTKMRGMGNAKVLMLLDGVPIHDPFYQTTQFYKVSLDNIERIEIVRGGNSSLWGSMAVAGVINIVSKRPKGDDATLNVSLDSRGSVAWGLTKNVRISDRWGFNLAVDDTSYKGYQTTPNDDLWRYPHKEATDAHNSNVQLTSDFKLSNTFNAYVRMGLHIQDQDISYNALGNNVQTNPDIAGGFDWRIDEKSRLQGTAWAQFVKFEKFNGTGCYWVSSTSCLSGSTATSAGTSNAVADYFTQYGSQRYREQGASSIYSHQLRGGIVESVQIGADVRRLSAADAEVFYSAPTSLTALQGNVHSTTYGEGKQQFQGVFAQTRITPLAPLELTLSAREDRWESTDRLAQRTKSGVTSSVRPTDTSISALNPSMGAKWNFTDAFAVRGATYKSFRVPGFNNTTRTYGTTTAVIANPDLSPEKLTGVEFGADYKTGALSVGATAFRYDIKNMIATYSITSSTYASAPTAVTDFCGATITTRCGTTVKYYTNDQDGRSTGLELNASWRASYTLTLNASYTRTDSILTRVASTVTDPVNVQLVAIPRNTALLSAQWAPTEQIKTWTELRYIGRMNIDTTTVSGTQFVQGSATVVDWSARYALDRNTDLTASVVNLFDRKYNEAAYTYNQPYSRTLSMPMTLTLGVKARF